MSNMFYKKERPYLLLYDGLCLFCSRSRRFIQYFDWLNLIETVDIYNENVGGIKHKISLTPEELASEIHLISRHGKVYRGFYACRKIGILLPITFVPALILYLPLVPRLGEIIYRQISNTRTRNLL